MNEPADIAEIVVELVDDLGVPDEMDRAEAFTYIRAAYGAGYTDGLHERQEEA